MAALHGRGAIAFARDRAEHPRVAGHNSRRRIGVERGDHHLEVARPQQVVAVEQGDVRRPSLRDRQVARPADATVLGFEQADAGIGEERHHCAGDIVGRAVVDHPALPVSQSLRLDRSQRFADEMGHAIGGHDHRDPRGRGLDDGGGVHARGLTTRAIRFRLSRASAALVARLAIRRVQPTYYRAFPGLSRDREIKLQKGG